LYFSQIITSEIDLLFFQEVRKSLLVTDVWNKSDDSPVTVADYG